jgi:Ring finger domain
MQRLFGSLQQQAPQQQAPQQQAPPQPSNPAGAIVAHKVQAPAKDLIEECAICTEEFNKRCDDVAFIDCMHWFHRKCIEDWLGRKNECVVCRSQTATIYKTR